MIIKDAHLPPLQWHLGRVENLHPENGSSLRTVTVRTSNGVHRRNVKHLAPLPAHKASKLVIFKDSYFNKHRLYKYISFVYGLCNTYI